MEFILNSFFIRKLRVTRFSSLRATADVQELTLTSTVCAYSSVASRFRALCLFTTEDQTGLKVLFTMFSLNKMRVYIA